MSAEHGIIDNNSKDDIIYEAVEEDHLLKQEPSESTADSIQTSQIRDQKIALVYDKISAKQKKYQTIFGIILYL